MARLRDTRGRFCKAPPLITPELLAAVQQARQGQTVYLDWGTTPLQMSLWIAKRYGPPEPTWTVRKEDEA